MTNSATVSTPSIPPMPPSLVEKRDLLLKDIDSAMAMSHKNIQRYLRFLTKTLRSAPGQLSAGRRITSQNVAIRQQIKRELPSMKAFVFKSIVNDDLQDELLKLDPILQRAQEVMRETALWLDSWAKKNGISLEITQVAKQTSKAIVDCFEDAYRLLDRGTALGNDTPITTNETFASGNTKSIAALKVWKTHALGKISG